MRKTNKIDFIHEQHDRLCRNTNKSTRNISTSKEIKQSLEQKVNINKACILHILGIEGSEDTIPLRPENFRN